MNIRTLITRLEAIASMSGDDQTVDIFCPEALDWYPITGFTYGGGDKKVRIYNDED